MDKLKKENKLKWKVIEKDIKYGLKDKDVKKLNNEAEKVAKIMKTEATKINRYINDNRKILPLLKAVDLYISHPIDTHWWRPIVRRYIKSDYEVFRDIKQRNKTRSRRPHRRPQYVY
jgi:uncharacterized protein YeeX (DUF496 family)